MIHRIWIVGLIWVSKFPLRKKRWLRLFDQTISLPKWLKVCWMVKFLSSRLFLFYVGDNCFRTSYVQSDWRKSSAKKSNKRLTIRIWTVCLDMYGSEVCSNIWISPSSMSKIVVSQNIDIILNRFCMDRYVLNAGTTLLRVIRIFFLFFFSEHMI